MCGRFTQSMTREDYLILLAEETERNIPYDPEPIGRFNVAPGTKVLLLSERDEKLHLDPVLWGYAPGWWDKAPLINARVETAPSSRMFKSLWQHGRAICFADGWFEWKKEGDKKQPYFIHRKDGKPIFMAAALHALTRINPRSSLERKLTLNAKATPEAQIFPA